MNILTSSDPYFRLDAVGHYTVVSYDIESLEWKEYNTKLLEGGKTISHTAHFSKDKAENEHKDTLEDVTSWLRWKVIPVQKWLLEGLREGFLTPSGNGVVLSKRVVEVWGAASPAHPLISKDWLTPENLRTLEENGVPTEQLHNELVKYRASDNSLSPANTSGPTVVPQPHPYSD